MFWDGAEDEVFAVLVRGCGMMPFAYPGDVLIVDRATQEIVAVVRVLEG